MPQKLMSQEDLEDNCPEMVEAFQEFIASRDDWNFDFSDEAIIYALAQTLHNRIEAIDMELEDKGAIVSTIVAGLCEFNGEALAAYREFINLAREQKSVTVH